MLLFAADRSITHFYTVVRLARKPFGGAKVRVDPALAEILRKQVGSKVTPSEMTKGIWGHIKRNKLLSK